MALNHGNKIARRIAVVTGTNRGIGFEICKQLSERGVITVMTSRDEQKGKKAMSDLLNILAKSGVDAKEKLFFHQLDIVSNDSIEKFKKYLVDNFQTCDILINNAGIYIDKWDEQTFKDTLETNVYGPMRFTNAILPLMKDKDFGRIVTLSSGYGDISHLSQAYKSLITKPDLSIKDLFNMPYLANDSQKEQYVGAYKVSKAMVNAHARLLQEELTAQGYKNIRVAAISPGWVKTDMGGPDAPTEVDQGAKGTVEFATADL